MGILGINNRTENWKTVRTLCPPLSHDAKVKLVQRLLGEYPDTSDIEAVGEVKFELFWYGARDCWEIVSAANSEDVYGSLFGDLRDKIEAFIGEPAEQRQSFDDLENWNYVVSDKIIVDRKDKPSIEELKSNLRYTEIDIVLETPSHLFIGEAKNESDLGAKGEYVLVHQLIRQYVMAKMLVKMMQKPHIVVPFIVGNKVEDLMKSAQVGFMIEVGWLKESNVLSWDCIKSVLEGSKPG